MLLHVRRRKKAFNALHKTQTALTFPVQSHSGSFGGKSYKGTLPNKPVSCSIIDKITTNIMIVDAKENEPLKDIVHAPEQINRKVKDSNMIVDDEIDDSRRKSTRPEVKIYSITADTEKKDVLLNMDGIVEEDTVVSIATAKSDAKNFSRIHNVISPSATSQHIHHKLKLGYVNVLQALTLTPPPPMDITSYAEGNIHSSTNITPASIKYFGNLTQNQSGEIIGLTKNVENNINFDHEQKSSNSNGIPLQHQFERQSIYSPSMKRFVKKLLFFIIINKNIYKTNKYLLHTEKEVYIKPSSFHQQTLSVMMDDSIAKKALNLQYQ